MKLKRSEVVIGRVYSMQHKRKGHFVGELIALADAPADDSQDKFFLTMKIDVRKGTDQARLANAGEAVAVKNIRPSLLLSIAETEREQWLRQVHVTRPPTQAELEQQEQERMAEALRQAMTQMKMAEAQSKPPSLFKRLIKH